MNTEQAKHLKSLITDMKAKQQVMGGAALPGPAYDAWIKSTEAVDQYIDLVQAYPAKSGDDYIREHLLVLQDIAGLSEEVKNEFTGLQERLSEFRFIVAKYLESKKRGMLNRLPLREDTLCRGMFLSGYIHRSHIDTVVELSKYNLAINSIIEHIRNE